MKKNTGVKPSCTLLFLLILPPLLSLALFVCLHLHILMARLHSSSPSWCVGFIHWRGGMPWWQHCSVHMSTRVCVCVCGCVSADMCMCRMKCRLHPMRHTCRHTCTLRGGGCCVRTEGSVGVQCELYLGFLSFTPHRVALWHGGGLLQCVRIYGSEAVVLVNQPMARGTDETRL